jgi:sugar phosphate permease
VDSLPFFYLTFVVLAFGTSLAGYFPLSIALVHWFEKKRARALSVLTMGFAVGGLVVPIVAWSLVTFGWRVTAFASGVIVLVAGWPLAGVVLNRPRDIGEVPDGEPAVRHAANPNAPIEVEAAPEFTAREALRTSAFWLVSLGHGFAMLVVGAINVHAITHMKEGLGYTVGQAALVISLQTVAQIGGILLGWVIGDRYEKRLIAAVCMLAHMIGLLLLAYAASLPMVIAFALLNGCAWGLRGSFMQAIRADYFGRSSIGMIMGLSSIVVVVGQIGGPLFAGVLADATGNYRLGFTVLAILAGLGSVFFVLARKPKAPARPAS